MIKPFQLFLHKVLCNTSPNNPTAGVTEFDGIRTWGQLHQLMNELKDKGLEPISESTNVGLWVWIKGSYPK